MEDMDTETVPVQSPSEKVPTDVIDGHRNCQTNEGKWLCLRDIYQKLQRPNIYDIGGTYVYDNPDFWFTYKTEYEHGIYLLHLFAGNRSEGLHSIAVSSECTPYHYKDDIVRLSEDVVKIIINCKENTNQSYVTTYSFTEGDVEEFLKDKMLYIAVQFPQAKRVVSGELKQEFERVKFSHDYSALLKNPAGSDFIIESDDGEEFPVHRHIMSTHSDVFKAMLKDDMAESQRGRVKLIDVAGDDIRALLFYLYTCNLPDLDNDSVNFSNLVMLADRFNLLGLRKLCSCVLLQNLSTENAIDILAIADMYNYSEARHKALQYIKNNKERFRGTKFDHIDNKGLLQDLCSCIFS